MPRMNDRNDFTESPGNGRDLGKPGPQGIRKPYGTCCEERTRELARANEAMKAEMRKRKLLEKKVLEVSAAEQRRIGQDLHDVLGQQLAGVAFMADLLKEKLRMKHLPEAADAAKIRGFLDEAIAQVRALARGLCPVELAAGDLGEGLKEFAEGVSLNRGIECSFRGTQPVVVQDDTTALHLFQIAREAVNNAVKHGKAGTISIRLDGSEKDVLLEVIDDGNGLGEVAVSGPLAEHDDAVQACCCGRCQPSFGVLDHDAFVRPKVMPIHRRQVRRPARQPTVCTAVCS